MPSERINDSLLWGRAGEVYPVRVDSNERLDMTYRERCEALRDLSRARLRLLDDPRFIHVDKERMLDETRKDAAFWSREISHISPV